MKQLVKKIFIFSIPILVWFFIEGLLPSNTFTMHPWESLLFHSRFAMGDFYHPNEEIEMESVGELCFRTPYARTHYEKWKTDINGFRNDSYVADPDILIIGDSFAVGDRLTQDSTITNLLKSDLQNKLKVYNIAPNEFSKLDYFLKYKLINKPKLVIYMKSERYIPKTLVKHPVPYSPNSLKSRLKAELKNNSVFNKLRVFLDKTFRMYSKNWVQARLSAQKGDGIPGKPGSNMFFWNIASAADDPNVVRSPSDFEKSAQRIITYKEYCDSLGIEFLFVPMPNKATVYFENVPYEKQPDYISNLVLLLNENNVKTYNTLHLFNQYRESHTKLLYHLDDTHWNSNGVQLVSKEIAKTIIAEYANLPDIGSTLTDGKISTR